MSRRGWVAAGMMAGAAAALAPTALRQVKALQQADPDVRGPLTWVPLPVPLMAKLTKSGILSAERALADGIDNRTQSVPAAEGRPAVRLELYRRQGLTGAVPALLWIHGGGYVMGAVTNDDDWCCRVAAELDVQVVSTDYRKAPEHPFPAALDDCFAALGWLIEHADELGVDPSRVMIGGNSAGGGLAAALAQRAHDAGLNVGFQLLVYPMLDDRTVPRAEAAGDYTLVWTPKANRYGWASYLGAEPGVGTPPPYAAPARRADLAGLPAAWIGVGSVDLFHDEDVEYARRLTDAGVDCTLYVAKGMPHGTNIGNEAPLPEAFNRAALNALAAALW